MKDYNAHTITSLCRDSRYSSFCVLLIRHEIVYDINMMAVTMAKMRFAKADPTLKKDFVLSAQQEDWIDRHISSALSKVTSSIRFAIRKDSRMASDEILEHPHQYAIPLRFEQEWTEEPDNLCKAIHDYVVRKCVADWALMTIPELLPTFKQLEEDALTEIHDIACSFKYDMVNPIL